MHQAWLTNHFIDNLGNFLVEGDSYNPQDLDTSNIRTTVDGERSGYLQLLLVRWTTPQDHSLPKQLPDTNCLTSLCEQQERAYMVVKKRVRDELHTLVAEISASGSKLPLEHTRLSQTYPAESRYWGHRHVALLHSAVLLTLLVQMGTTHFISKRLLSKFL